MKLLLYSLEPPRGRCLLLAQKLRQTTDIPGSKSVEIAQRLFDGQHTSSNPITVAVPDIKSANDLMATCAEFGIAVEIVDVADGRSILH